MENATPQAKPAHALCGRLRGLRMAAGHTVSQTEEAEETRFAGREHHQPYHVKVH